MTSQYYDLGTYSRPVTTASRDAQLWFDRGLVWTYGFNHEEAVRCFEKAVEADPDCAMAFWGIAYSLGPNYNKPWEDFEENELSSTVARAFHATNEAVRLSEGSTLIERAIIGTLPARYPSITPAADYSVWNLDYVDRLRQVYREHPADLDVATLFADALMLLTPWALWDQATGEPAAGSRTVEAVHVLETALLSPAANEHPGVLHMYVHLLEMSSQPERAMDAGEKLALTAPDAGHLVHMLSHIDVLCGDYERALDSNSAAIIADEKFVLREGPVNFYTLYRAHNYHFKIYAAMFLGQSEIALRTADELARSVPEELLRIESPPMANWLEGFVSMRVHVLIRFGKWQEIIELELPDDHELYCVTTAMLHYGKSVACSATGRIAEAEEQKQLFDSALGRVPASRTLFNNTCLDILKVAEEMLDGELEYRKANYDSAFAHLRRSVELYDSLPYDEPWGWMQPARHALGALLLEQGHTEEAEAVYRADLGLDDTLARANQHPNNVWSLHGYHECLERLGKTAEADALAPQLEKAVSRADVPVKSSCACRMSQVP
ncbi:tetratricopeptide repeat protein [Homoserinimonas sp. OAct 916]|uniref:tetratricopeptide repeat protein n=1 Tax=Homoserinimonas sp. OAct 916 TaxID=2211450 RepID=UPI000DBE2248|nr:tetratricopeptide repeat protein [Homoserinimonas sp. OAct 916]